MAECVLHVANVDTSISGSCPCFAQIDKELSYSLEGYRFSPAFRGGRWDGKIHLFKNGTFPAGLTTRVVGILAANGVKYRIEDSRTKSPTINDLKKAYQGSSEDFLQPLRAVGVELRPFQQGALVSMLKFQRGVLVLSTGAGKTITVVAALKILDLPTAFVVHTKTLLSQTAEVFQKAGIDVKVYGGGRKEFGRVTIFTVQSLMRLIKSKNARTQLDKFQILVIDEVHHVSSTGQKASWYVSSRHFTNAHIRFGLTATPNLKKTGMLLEAAIGPIIHEIPISELQGQGHLSTSQIKFLEISSPNLHYENYRNAYLYGIVKSVPRNALVKQEAERLAKEGRIVLVFVERIDHGEILNELIEDSIFLSGNDDAEYIADVKQLTKDRQVKILIVTRKLFGEGVDIPVVDALINAAGGKSPVVFTQMFGRGLRIAEGKTELQYIDFLDNTNKHLLAHANSRIRTCKYKLKQQVIIRDTEGGEHVHRNTKSGASIERRYPTSNSSNRKWGSYRRSTIAG